MVDNKEVSEVKEVGVTPDEALLKVVKSSAEITELPKEAAKSEEKLLDVDRLALELAKSKRQLALEGAKTALAQNEKAELEYKYVVLQLYMKYNLTEADAIDSDSGKILRNGALPKQG